MQKTLFSLLCGLTLITAAAQTKKPVANNASIARPKLVVGIVIDQMRWDFLYRYYDQYKADGGFKRLLGEGFTCENNMIPYAPTITACGHTCAYTGSVPNVHGITGNAWWDSKKMRSVYCSEDNDVETVGSNTAAGKMSPKNMLVTTICDELRLATNFKSKVIGVAIKDRGAILPAGHSANAAYWYDNKTGNWISSTWYMQQLPKWVQDFNNKKITDSLYKLGWSTLYPIDQYTQSTSDEQAYEGKPFGSNAKGFPYDLSGFIGKNYNSISTTPHGNTLTMLMASAALEAEELGKDAVTDFLAVSFSSPDYVGHSFGPNSIEVQDTYLRLDQTLGAFLNKLDQQVGKGNYTIFLTADHGVAHVPGFMKANKLPAEPFDDAALMKQLNASLKEKFATDSLVVSMYNYQVHLNHKKIRSAQLDEEAITTKVIDQLRMHEQISHAFSLMEMDEYPLNATIRERIKNGYYPIRSGDIQFILKPGYIDGGNTGTTHGLWNPYDSHIPLVWYGWGIKQGKLNRETYMTDIAPTLAALLRIQMPNGSVGHVIPEVMK